MKLQSPNFKNNGYIPSKHTCDGYDVSPALQITDVPENTNSLALIVEDPDAEGKDFTHWLVWNISPSEIFINEGQVPVNAVQGINDFGNIGYDGPCPPSGIHRYFFQLHALNDFLNLKEGSKKDELKKIIQDKIIASAKLIGLYAKPNPINNADHVVATLQGD